MFVPTKEGYWISEEYVRLEEVIQTFDPLLELRFIPPDKRTREDKKPYVIVDTRNEQPVLYAGETDSPVDILARLFKADGTKNNVLSDLEAYEEAKRVYNFKAWLDKMEEAAEQRDFVMKTPKNTFTMDGKKWVDKKVVGPAVDRKFIS